MLYITRSRCKESVKPGDLLEINRLIDTEWIPAMENIEGVRSVRAYNSITGEVAFILDIQDLASIDRLLVDPDVRQVLGRTLDYFVRTGGEVLYDRPQWQGLYGRD